MIYIFLLTHNPRLRLLVNLSGVALHLLHCRVQFGEQFVVGVNREQVFLSQQEAQAVSFCSAQTVS